MFGMPLKINASLCQHLGRLAGIHVAFEREFEIELPRARRGEEILMELGLRRGHSVWGRKRAIGLE